MMPKEPMERRPARVNAIRKQLILASGAMLTLGLAVFFLVVPHVVSSRMNGVAKQEESRYPSIASGLTVDLHADSLLWARDPARYGAYGHVDLPRMLAAGHGVQVFSAVTQVPRGLNFERNGGDSDQITLLTIAQRWPPRTWTSLLERALYQSDRLHRLEREAEGAFVIIKDRDALGRYLERRAQGDQASAGILAIEGMHAIERDLGNIDRLFQAGFRIMGLVHLFDNDLGGSAHGEQQGGLTTFGAAVVRRMEQRGVIVDLAHASPELFQDVLAIASRPLVVTHVGVRGTCDNERNLSDAQLDAIAAGGGLVGIAFFEHAVCGADVDAIVRAIRYAIDRVGIDTIALGSDFDGGVTTPFDITGLGRIAAGLKASGLSDAEISQVMGGNALRFLRTQLPLI